MLKLAILVVMLCCCSIVYSQSDYYCCSPQQFETDVKITMSTSIGDMEFTDARLYVDQDNQKIALHIEQNDFPVYKLIIDFQEEKSYFIIPLLANFCVSVTSTFPFSPSCVTEEQTLLDTARLGFGDNQLDYQVWNRNRANVLHTQARTLPEGDMCYLLSETYQDGAFKSTIDFMNMIDYISDTSVFTPPYCIDIFDLFGADTEDIPPVLRFLLTGDPAFF